MQAFFAAWFPNRIKPQNEEVGETFSVSQVNGVLLRYLD